MNPMLDPTGGFLGLSRDPRRTSQGPLARPFSAPAQLPPSAPVEPPREAVAAPRRGPDDEELATLAAELALDTDRGRIVRALRLLGAGEHSAADIAVKAWSIWREAFCLPRHPQHADACKVRAKLSGVDGLVARGFVARRCEGCYSLTKRGRRWCDAVARGVRS